MNEQYLNINSGKYKLNANLNLEIIENLKFCFGEHYLLEGENGSGKTSFLTSLLLPELNKINLGKYLYFHSDQDIILQIYLIKSYYYGYLKQKTTNKKTIEDNIIELKNKFINLDKIKFKNIIFVFDEIDQYVSFEKIFENINFENCSIIVVSHNSTQLPDNIVFKKVQFTTVNQNNTILKK